MFEPQMCGGTSQHTDNNAPKEILSDHMILFRAETSLQNLISLQPMQEECRLDYISAFAAKTDGGSFLLLQTRSLADGDTFAKAYVKADIFPALVALVREAQLAQNNGRSSFTYGLPMNFGGSVNILYESGESIVYANNQSPVFGKDVAARIHTLFTEALQSEPALLPDAERITEVRLVQDNTMSQVRMELRCDGESCHLTKVYQFEEPEPHVYESTVPLAVMETVRTIIRDNALLLWDQFPPCGFDLPIQKSLTFVFDDGSEITVHDDRMLPLQMSSVFFNIESALKA